MACLNYFKNSLYSVTKSVVKYYAEGLEIHFTSLTANRLLFGLCGCAASVSYNGDEFKGEIMLIHPSSWIHRIPSVNEERK